jgi:4-hydroxythreonine-4-phosphate dehydrogenase
MRPDVLKPIALTMGDPAGIGGEITAAAWQALRQTGPAFFLIGDPDWLRRSGADLPVAVIERPEEAAAQFTHAVPVLPLALQREAIPGRPDPANAPAVIQSIEQAVAHAKAGTAGAIATNPIAKSVLYQAGFAHPGHTEFLAALTGSHHPVMMLAAPELRVVPVTIHVALRRALDMLSTEGIIAAGRITAAALIRDFGIAQPRLAVAGVNPHAGEAGAMGDEEGRIIAPAVAALRESGIEVSGPLPPDTMFTQAARRRYDAALCMYHDQALIPLKTIDMEQGVNVTLGLPIIRTSPDHGTAFDIAGKGIASPASLISALRMAAAMAAAREGSP